MNGDIDIYIANDSSITDVLEFQRRYIKVDNQAIYAREFHCESGLRRAIKKNNVLVAYSSRSLVAMVRFYCQVRQLQISIYQFAVIDDFRGAGLSEKMFTYLQRKYSMDLVSKCPVDNHLNRFYQANDWDLFDHQSGLNYWKKPQMGIGVNYMEFDEL